MEKVSVILPCLNEEESIGQSIQKIQDVFLRHGIHGEIIVVDNNSTDNSAKIAQSFRVKYVFEPKRGYGNAYLSGFKHVKGKFLIMGDPDNSYDFNEIPRFLKYLQNNEVVLGSRFMGRMEKGAMPLLHRYIGNPGFKLLLKIFFNIKITEPSTGFVGLRKECLEKLKLKERGMEFAIETIIRIKRKKLKLKEIPIIYHRRSGKSKLRTFRDGFRYLRFIIIERFR